MLTLSHLQGFNAFTSANASIIASIQALEITIGTDATSATATITSVDTSRAVIFWGGFATSDSTVNQAKHALTRIELTNATTVTAYRDTADALHTVTVRATVVEFAATAVTSVQQGTIALAADGDSGTASITSVATSRAALFYLGHIAADASYNTTYSNVAIDLTNSTTVTATRGFNNHTVTVGFAVVEFATSTIASVQSRSVTFTSSNTSETDTITSVDAARAMILYHGMHTLFGAAASVHYRVELTNGTTVTLTRTGTGTQTRTIKYMVLEFATGVVRSLQRGNTPIASATSADTAITSVNTAKAIASQAGFSTTTGTIYELFPSSKLNSATQMRCQKGAAGSSTSTPSWEVAEFE